MKILFDQGTPVPLRRLLSPHSVDTAYELGWQSLENGELLSAAEKGGYELVITTDQNLKYQQNLSDRKIAVVVLLSTSWPRIRQRVDTIIRIVETVAAGSYEEVPIP
jgi:hypothetical protein